MISKINKVATKNKIVKNKTALIIQKVASELGFKSRFIDSFNFVLAVDFGSKNNSNEHIFIASNYGLNNESITKLCKDKFYTYLLLKNTINLPKTFIFVDPNADDLSQDYSLEPDNSKVVEKILANHIFPIIVKANSLSRGINIFKCESRKQVESAVKTIFNQKSKNYDHVLISQDYIDIESEYRVVVYNKKIMFVYKKDNFVEGNRIIGEIENEPDEFQDLESKDLVEQGGINDTLNLDQNKNILKFTGNLSPLHWENSRAVLIEDLKTLSELDNFIKPVFNTLDLKYGGLDIVKDKNGKLWLIEINSQPGFSFFIRDNGDLELKKMYRKILNNL